MSKAEKLASELERISPKQHTTYALAAARHTVDTEWTRCDEALRTALSQPQQCNETPTTLPSEASKVKEERTCSFCKHHDDAKNYDETCWGCSTFYSNKWEPRT